MTRYGLPAIARKLLKVGESVSVPNVTRLSNPPASISAPKDPHAILRTIRQIWNEILNDDCVDLAASMAYFFVLALFPCFVVSWCFGWIPSLLQFVDSRIGCNH